MTYVSEKRNILTIMSQISAGGVGQWADGEDHAAVDGAVRDARSRSEGASGFSADVVAVGGTPRVVEKGHT